MADLSYEDRKRLRRAAEDARDACNRHYGPFVDAVAHPLNILALLDMADRAAHPDADKVDAPLSAGGPLSNVAYNLAQLAGEPLTSDWSQALDNARKAWDAARAQQGGQS